MQQRQLVACAAFPHNTWRLCNSCFIPSPRTLCATSTSSSSCAPHSSRSIVCHAATPPQPGQPGFPQQQGFGGQYPGYTGAQSPLSSRDSVDDAVPSLQLPNIPRPVPPRYAHTTPGLRLTHNSIIKLPCGSSGSSSKWFVMQVPDS